MMVSEEGHFAQESSTIHQEKQEQVTGKWEVTKLSYNEFPGSLQPDSENPPFK